MAQKMITIHMKNRKVNVIPEAGLPTFKRLFHAQIDYIEEEEGTPIIAKPVIEEIKKPGADAGAKTPKADASMNKKALQDLAKDLAGYDASMKKADLIELINK